jgi:hypothetical protein
MSGENSYYLHVCSWGSKRVKHNFSNQNELTFVIFIPKRFEFFFKFVTLEQRKERLAASSCG